MCILSEINSQAKSKHLTIKEVEDMGRHIALSVGEFFQSNAGHSIMKLASAWRKRRKKLKKRYMILNKQVKVHEKNGPFYVEGNLNLWLPSTEAHFIDKISSDYPPWILEADIQNVGYDFFPDWLKRVYQQEGIGPWNLPEKTHKSIWFKQN